MGRLFRGHCERMEAIILSLFLSFSVNERRGFTRLLM